MVPEIWKSTFVRIGWEQEWLGPELGLLRYRQTVRAARILVSPSIYDQIKEFTGPL
jgi:hypothetical protein